MCGFTVVFFDPDRSGYEAAAKHFCPADLDVNVTGRSFMITGCNSGIGKAAAQEIANKGGFHKPNYSSQFVLNGASKLLKNVWSWPQKGIYYLRFNVNDKVSLFLGGTVHMVCRNRERAEAAREEIVERSKNQVKFVAL